MIPFFYLRNKSADSNLTASIYTICCIYIKRFKRQFSRAFLLFSYFPTSMICISCYFRQYFQSSLICSRLQVGVPSIPTGGIKGKRARVFSKYIDYKIDVFTLFSFFIVIYSFYGTATYFPFIFCSFWQYCEGNVCWCHHYDRRHRQCGWSCGNSNAGEGAFRFL